MAFLKKPKSFQIVLNKLYDDANADDEEGTEPTVGAEADEKLMAMLLELRQKEAKRVGLVSWVIFLENTLQDMATMYPTTLEELEKCQGVSKGKAVKYGKPFVDLIKRYVEENNIERPDDFVELEDGARPAVYEHERDRTGRFRPHVPEVNLHPIDRADELRPGVQGPGSHPANDPGECSDFCVSQ